MILPFHCFYSLSFISTLEICGCYYTRYKKYNVQKARHILSEDILSVGRYLLHMLLILTIKNDVNMFFFVHNFLFNLLLPRVHFLCDPPPPSVLVTALSTLQRYSSYKIIVGTSVRY